MDQTKAGPSSPPPASRPGLSFLEQEAPLGPRPRPRQLLAVLKAGGLPLPPQGKAADLDQERGAGRPDPSSAAEHGSGAGRPAGRGGSGT